MKRIYSILQPVFPIILGALLLLLYINGFSAQGAWLGLGIVGIIVAVIYLVVGILPMILGEKLPSALKTVFGIGSIIAFPIFFFIQELLFAIQGGNVFTISGWIIAIISMVAGLAFAFIFGFRPLLKGKVVGRLLQIFALCFVLSLVLDLVFAPDGTAYAFGDIPFLYCVLYAVYCAMLFPALAKGMNEPEEKQEEAPEESQEEAQEESKEETVEEEPKEQTEETSEEPTEVEEEKPEEPTPEEPQKEE